MIFSINSHSTLDHLPPFANSSSAAASFSVSVTGFDSGRQAKFFHTLKQIRYSGNLTLRSKAGRQWAFHMYLGRIVYVAGGEHPTRAWQRCLVAHCPQINWRQPEVRARLMVKTPDLLPEWWQYQLLCHWVTDGHISRDQAIRIAEMMTMEALFDISQVGEVAFFTHRGPTLPAYLVVLDPEKVIGLAGDLWRRWQEAKLADRSPNLAPAIHQLEQLQRQAPGPAYEGLKSILTGQQTFRDLATFRKRDVVEIAAYLLPYLQSGALELVEVKDLPPPLTVSPPPATVKPASPRGPLVVCVDDSPQVLQAMQTILTGAGYRFQGIQDPLRAVPSLLGAKPDLVFLDLVMPNTNGYEVCTQLRKVSALQKVPVVILTGNDGIVDRVRARVAGASDFLAKPVEGQTVIATVEKHLHQTVQPSPGIP